MKIILLAFILALIWTIRRFMLEKIMRDEMKEQGTGMREVAEAVAKEKNAEKEEEESVAQPTEENGN